MYIQLKHNLHVSVFDWDRFSTDDKLGFAHLNLEPMMHAQEHTEDIELSEQGFVTLNLRWVPLGKELPLPPIRIWRPRFQQEGRTNLSSHRMLALVRCAFTCCVAKGSRRLTRTANQTRL